MFWLREKKKKPEPKARSSQKSAALDRPLTPSVLLPGIRMGSLGLFMQCATSTIFSLIMSHLVRHFGSRTVYVSSMVCFTLSALVICLSRSVFLTIVMTSLTGFAYAMLQTLPYTLTCHYHAKKEVSTHFRFSPSNNNQLPVTVA